MAAGQYACPAAIFAVALTLLSCAKVVLALTPGVTVTANPSILLADGKSRTTITVTLSDISGSSIPDGTIVHFSATSGTVEPDASQSIGGVARTTLTSSPIAGHSVVSVSFIGPQGGANGETTVEFTADKGIANTDDVAANWIRVNSRDYLAYSADCKTIDAAGKNGGVHLTFRGLSIDADAMQIDLSGNTVRARKATLHRSQQAPVQAAEILYYLDAHQGTALIENKTGRRAISEMNVDGTTLAATPIPQRPLSTPETDYDFKDLSAGHVLITAAGVSVNPGVQIQLARATIYVDSKKLVSMPNQVMPLSTDQLFGQQVLGYGTDGVFLDVPYYASLTPTSSGTFSLRSQEAAVQAGTFQAGRSQLALDYDHTYTHGASQVGDFKVNNLMSGQFGLRWTQSQTLRDGSQTYFYFDSPAHKSLYSSATIRHDFTHYSADLSMTRTDLLSGGTGGTSNSSNFNLQSVSHTLLGQQKFGLRYTEFFSYAQTNSVFDYDGGSTKYSSANRNVGLRFDTPSITPMRKTTVTDSMTVEQSYSYEEHFAALNYSANLTSTTQLGPTTNAVFTYGFNHRPVFGQQQVTTGVAINPGLSNLYSSADQQNLSLGFLTGSLDQRWTASINSTYGLPNSDSTISSDLGYRVSKSLKFSLDNYVSRFAGYGFQDTDLSFAQRIGGRDLVISWSTMLHRFRFNLEQIQF